MKKDNMQILIHASASKAIDLLVEVDVLPGVNERKIDAAIQRLEDIKAISRIEIT
tara:strand:+ start:92 stop:256 length:165 start_codon:yes stop_codon:yes gene_type:complete